MELELVPRQVAGAELAHCGKFRHCLLHGQVTCARRLADLTSAVWTGGRLVLQPRVCQEMVVAAGTHQVSIHTLQIPRACSQYHSQEHNYRTDGQTDSQTEKWNHGSISDGLIDVYIKRMYAIVHGL